MGSTSSKSRKFLATGNSKNTKVLNTPRGRSTQKSMSMSLSRSASVKGTLDREVKIGRDPSTFQSGPTLGADSASYKTATPTTVDLHYKVPKETINIRLDVKEFTRMIDEDRNLLANSCPDYEEPPLILELFQVGGENLKVASNWGLFLLARGVKEEADEAAGGNGTQESAGDTASATTTPTVAAAAPSRKKQGRKKRSQDCEWELIFGFCRAGRESGRLNSKNQLDIVSSGRWTFELFQSNLNGSNAKRGPQRVYHETFTLDRHCHEYYSEEEHPKFSKDCDHFSYTAFPFPFHAIKQGKSNQGPLDLLITAELLFECPEVPLEVNPSGMNHNRDLLLLSNWTEEARATLVEANSKLFSGNGHNTNYFSDLVNFTFPLIIRGGSPIVKAHRNILAAYSSVFKEMFDSKVDKKRPVVPLEDISPKGLEIVLRCLYFAQPPQLTLTLTPGEKRAAGEFNRRDDESCTDSKSSSEWVQYAAEILHFSEKYKVEPLLEFCGHFLSKACTHQNALELFKAAKMYKMEEAMEEIIQYIKRYSEEIAHASEDSVSDA